MPVDQAAAYWEGELGKSDADLARGERIPAIAVHKDVLRALEELEIEMAAAACAANVQHTGR